MKIASLSAELQHDPEHLLRNMHGGTRSIARYLKEVVLDPLPEEVLDFLGKNVLPQSVKCRIMQRSDRTR